MLGGEPSHASRAELPPGWLRYGSAVVLTIAVTFVAMQWNEAIRHPYLVEWPAVIGAAWFGGLGPGLIASLLSTAAIAFFWIEPVRSLRVAHTGDVIGLVLYAVCAVVITLLIADLHRARAEERRLRRSRETVLGIVAHDLRNPLGTITMASWLLRRNPTDLPRRLDVVDRATKRMDRLIQDLLDASKLDNDVPLAMVLADEDLASVVGEAVASVTPDATARSIRIVVDLPPGLRVRCDGERMLQAIGNLLGNAVKFTPEAGRIAVRAVADEAFVRVEISDTGPGIKPEQQAKIFERHWTGGAGSSGAGLGLFITRGIIHAHGGRIWLHSAPGHGSTFFLTIPAAAQTESQPHGADVDRLRLS